MGEEDGAAVKRALVVVSCLLAACGSSEALADRQVCDAAGRATSALISGSHREALAAAERSYALAERAEDEAIRDAAALVGIAAETVELNESGLLGNRDFLTFSGAVNELDDLCIEKGLTD